MNVRTLARSAATLIALSAPALVMAQTAVSMAIAFTTTWPSKDFPSMTNSVTCQGKVQGTDKNGDGYLTYSKADPASNEATLMNLTCFWNVKDWRKGWQAGCGKETDFGANSLAIGRFKVKAAPGSYAQGSPDLDINVAWRFPGSNRTCELKTTGQFGPYLQVTDDGGSDSILYTFDKGPSYAGKPWTFTSAP